MEAAVPGGPVEEWWRPRGRWKVFDPLSHRTLEIAGAISTATWKTLRGLRVSHSSHSPGDDGLSP